MKRLAWAVAALLASAPLRAATPASQKKMLDGVGFDQNLGKQAPMDAVFRDSDGRAVRFGDLFRGKPVVLAFVYYKCPMLCTETLNGLVRALRALSFDAGLQFDVATVSIDPRETPALAAAKKAPYVERYGRAGAARGWSFLTGDSGSIRRLAGAAGFRYAYDAELDQYAHATGLIVLTPEGRISRYLYGVEYAAGDLRLALVEATAGTIGSPVDQLLLYCYHYDPLTGQYGLLVTRALRVAGALTVVLMAALIARSQAAAAEARWAVTFPFFPVEASTAAPRVDALMAYVLLIALAFIALVGGLILYFVVKYHHRARADRSKPVFFSLPLELAWTLIPLILTLSIFFWGAKLFIAMREPPPGALEVYVVGKQWMWELQHAEGRRELNELHVPAGRPVELIMTSADVIHSFYVPAFRVKQDVLPGRYTTEWFEASAPGRYRLFCAQYCGTAHSAMGGWITALTPADYQRWLAGEADAAAPGTTMAGAGAQLFQRLGCAACHREGGTGTGPALAGLYGRTVALEGGGAAVADESYLRESIMRPNAKIVKGWAPRMPTYEGRLDEEQLQQLVAYLKTLKGA